VNFYTCQNNGVVAIVNEEVYNDLKKANEIWMHFDERDRNGDLPDEERWRGEVAIRATAHLAVPIFTFVHGNRHKTSPWFTGGEELWSALYNYLENSGATVRGSSFFVPFSNGAELGIHGKDAMMSELKHVTTSTHFLEVFGISQTELLDRVRHP